VIGHLQVNKLLTEENEQTCTYAYIGCLVFVVFNEISLWSGLSFYETVLGYISMKIFALVTRNVTDTLEKHKGDTANMRGSQV
jgi:hypothetical protein